MKAAGLIAIWFASVWVCQKKIKGWTKFTDTAVDGLIRGIRTWADFEGDKLWELELLKNIMSTKAAP